MSFRLKCSCGEVAATEGRLTYHQNRCEVAKMRSRAVYETSQFRDPKRQRECDSEGSSTAPAKSRRSTRATIDSPLASSSPHVPHVSRRRVEAIGLGRHVQILDRSTATSLRLPAHTAPPLDSHQARKSPTPDSPPPPYFPRNDEASAPDTMDWDAPDISGDPIDDSSAPAEVDHTEVTAALDQPTTALSPQHNASNVHDSPIIGKRVRKPSANIREALDDALPEGPGPLIPPPVQERSVPLQPRVRLIVVESFRTLANSFGLSRLYRGRPSSVPDMDVEFEELVADNARVLPIDATKSVADIISPYPNLSSFLLNRWFWNGGAMKSRADRKSLLKDVVLHPDFKSEDLRDVNFEKIDEELAEDQESPWEGNGWVSSTITIDIPTGQKTTKASRRAKANSAQSARRHDEIDPDAPEIETNKFSINGFHHRNLLAVVREAFESSSAKRFHFHPFRQTWQPPFPSAPPERVFDNVYTAEAFLRADRDLQNSPREAGCDLPRAVAGFMFWSDATHVAQFGQAKLWPIYAYFANQCKYERCKPTARAAYCVAYLSSLPDSVQDFVRKNGRGATAPLLAHCRRELFHEAWVLLLDDDFIEAYKHGIIVDCADGVRRRLYPRILTYSADYPEKVLIATIRDMGGCPCPRCLIKKDQIVGLGTRADQELRTNQARTDNEARRTKVASARDLIYKHGYVVTSEHVENLLKPESLNAFSRRLSQFKFDFFTLLVVDLMHEFELGVWKAVLAHLIRILFSIGSHAVHEFNERFRSMPTFGRSTIRRFARNVADLTRLAARDYEDILQCCIPCFDGLFPAPHNESILSLLYILAYWHSLAKLRMHTESSLKVLDQATVLLGQRLRFFADETCKHFRTVETDKEYAARSRATQREKARAQQITSSEQPQSAPPLQGSSGKRAKSFSLATSKLHALGDYTQQIRYFGTTDSFSSQIGELQHRVVKNWNDRTSKNNAVPQIVKIDVREAVHNRMLSALTPSTLPAHGDVERPIRSPDCAAMKQHHRIAADESGEKLYLGDWLLQHRQDPAFEDFLPKLRAHLLARLRGISTAGDAVEFTPDELNQVNFQFSRIYPHATAGFNYTSYDVRRDQDTINVHGDRRYIMVRGQEESDDGDPHPFWYARVLGIYHAKIYYKSERTPRRMEFLWVRWFGRDPDWHSGAKALRLDRIGYIPAGNREVHGDAFGFVDPAQVLRACHLVPAYSQGCTTQLLGRSIARDTPAGDWVNYHVMRFVDRDMMMRYLGLGVGHINEATFPTEKDQLQAIQEENHIPTPATHVDSEERDGEENFEPDRDDEWLVDIDEEAEISDGEMAYEY
ncbi:hypothetical protein BV22DRAFT_1195981 [Leucogyrophana mollusca]|uniref:Uncharacterized protein n=1 Tax=Leucogyrophana mollusca TaxID=85980 RepID=A0ACB8BGQ5_9AGAM|nr:hypothetical protein BV22DRAFT_1195981 [Leucogyrophana mollusca]